MRKIHQIGKGTDTIKDVLDSLLDNGKNNQESISTESIHEAEKRFNNDIRDGIFNHKKNIVNKQIA